MNNINLIGRLGKDPEIRYFEDGKVVGKVTIAVKRWGEGADWFNIEIWGKQAQTLGDYCRKGDQIAVIGRMQQDSYQDRQTGEERKTWTVKVSNLELLAKAGDRGQAPAPEAPPAPAPVAAPAPAARSAAPSWHSSPAANWDQEEVPF